MSSTSLAVALCLAGSITLGCTGPAYDTRPPFVPDPPAVYVAKVKNLLVGLPPTDDEVTAVTKDPNALGGLIDGWMALPQYQQKMKVFFELAFQQTQITVANLVDIVPPNGLGNGQSLPLVVQNMRESFALTVNAINAAGQPLTNAFTTKQLMMTPALMQFYAFVDGRRADDLGKIADVFAKAKQTITLEAAQGPIPISRSLDPNDADYMTFYSPDILTIKYPDPACDAIDPVRIPNANSTNFFDIMYGQIPQHVVGTVVCPIRGGSNRGLQLLATDFTDWNPVTIRPPVGSEASSQFYDLPTLRAKHELVIGTPRPGFFTTPAFQANWPTNSSNQMRVTLNQALIVATGTAIDGNDPTSLPLGQTPGLDQMHAAPGSACYGCHQLLDPTRSILSATYSWFYNPQTDKTLTAIPGTFAFQGVVQPMTTIDDFANILANHPLVAQAWGEKLCYYANSAPCDPNDKEFQRIVGNFANGFSWNGLVRDLLASPITTNVSETTTYGVNGEIVAVARRDHLCAALNNRLGFIDICQLDESHQTGKINTVSEIVSGMPSDGYGRGATIPILPNQPTLFYRGGLENICASVSGMVVDAAVDPLQPGAKHWSSGQADAAIGDFVAQIMGLTASDARTPQVTDALTQHFAAAKAAGSTATDALRSTFVAACLSPTFIGIGM